MIFFYAQGKPIQEMSVAVFKRKIIKISILKGLNVYNELCACCQSIES